MKIQTLNLSKKFSTWSSDSSMAVGHIDCPSIRGICLSVTCRLTGVCKTARVVRNCEISNDSSENGCIPRHCGDSHLPRIRYFQTNREMSCKLQRKGRTFSSYKAESCFCHSTHWPWRDCEQYYGYQDQRKEWNWNSGRKELQIKCGFTYVIVR